MATLLTATVATAPSDPTDVVRKTELDVVAALAQEALDTAEAAGGGAGTNGWQSLTTSDIAAGGTTTLTMAAAITDFRTKLAAGTGAGAYTRAIVLPVTDRVAGDALEICVQMPASANPTLTFHTTTDATTALFTISPDAAQARTYALLFVFNGTAWELFRQMQNV